MPKRDGKSQFFLRMFEDGYLSLDEYEMIRYYLKHVKEKLEKETY